MTLTTRDIQEKQFHDAFRGYSHEEVDLFIDEVAESFEQLQREKHALNARIEQLQEQLQNAQTQAPDDMLKRLLVTAQETADKAIQNARAKAQAMMEEAENRAKLIREQAEALSTSRLQEAERRAQQTLASVTSQERDLRSRIEGMKKFEVEFRNRLTAFIRSQLELFERSSLVQADLKEELPVLGALGSFTEAEPVPLAGAADMPSWDELGSDDPFLSGVGESNLHAEPSILDPGYAAGPAQPADVARSERQVPSPPEGEPLSDLEGERLLQGEAFRERSPREAGPVGSPPPAAGTAPPTQPTPVPEVAAADEPVREREPKDENRSIRELFWGEE